jgi:hypothetical protein
MTSSGGTFNSGTIFKMTSSGVITIPQATRLYE